LGQRGVARKLETLPLEISVMELDEMYCQKKRKVWLWLAICRASKQILAYQLGGRGVRTAKKLWGKIK